MSVNSVLISRLKEISSDVMYAAEAQDLHVVLKRIAQVARELVNCRYAAIGVPDEDGGLRYFETSGMSDEQITAIPYPHPTGKGLIGAIMEVNEPIRIAHMRDHEKSVGFPANHPPMESFLGVPIVVGNQRFGMMYLSDREDGQPFSENDEMLAEALAGYVAMAIAGTMLSGQQNRMNLLQERERIGMELHDGIIQSLYGIGMQIDLLRQEKELIPAQEVAPVIDSLNDVIEDIRGYIMDLRWRDSNGRTVYDCFDDIRQRLHVSNHVKVAIDAPYENPPFTPATFESICLIVNEALSNAVRHSSATEITISAYREMQAFHVEVEDNGKGFDLNQVKDHTGLGLRNMQRRARFFGGEVTIASEVGKGTHLEIAIPIRAY